MPHDQSPWRVGHLLPDGDGARKKIEGCSQVLPPLVDSFYVAKACYQIVPSYATEPATPYGGLLSLGDSPRRWRVVSR